MGDSLRDDWRMTAKTVGDSNISRSPDTAGFPAVWAASPGGFGKACLGPQASGPLCGQRV
jgi:hypothetical protein